MQPSDEIAVPTKYRAEYTCGCGAQGEFRNLATIDESRDLVRAVHNLTSPTCYMWPSVDVTRMSSAGTIEALQAKCEALEKEREELADGVSRERAMWKNAVKTALDGYIHLIGRPSQSNEIRDCLQPVATLQAKYGALEKERDGLKAELLKWLHGAAELEASHGG